MGSKLATLLVTSCNNRYTTSSGGTDKKFTGQRLDEGTGLYYYGARYYDPSIGRFISPDTIIPDPMNPQAFNRYSYCVNNPLKYIDPTGNRWINDGCAPRKKQPPPPPPPPPPPQPPDPTPEPPSPASPPTLMDDDDDWWEWWGDDDDGDTGTETEPDLPIESDSKDYTLENIGIFIVGYLLIEVGTVWTIGGVALIEIPPAAALMEIVAAAHYYTGVICISNSIQGKGFPTGGDFLQPALEVYRLFREIWSFINPR